MARLGHAPRQIASGRYDDSTSAAVAAFQAERGVAATGVCDAATWTALVEAGWQLGDRLLHHTSPNMRGDDVVELQGTLARLGFDCGRVDGIFGPNTVRALADFQRNSGLPDDGVCGADTVRALVVSARQTGSGPGVVSVREVVDLTSGDRSLSRLRVVVGHVGGLSALARQVTQALRQRAASVSIVDSPDPVEQAAAANRFSAHCFVGFEAVDQPVNTLNYFAVPAFESAGGRALATQVQQSVVRPLRPDDVTIVGMRLPVLRETVMPAVLWQIGPTDILVRHTPDFARAVVMGVSKWVDDPVAGLPHPE